MVLAPEISMAKRGNELEMFSFPNRTIDGRQQVGFFPCGLAGITFDLISRQATTYGGRSNTNTTQLTRTENLPQTAELTYMTVVVDADCQLYLQGSKKPIYLPGGIPIGVPIEGVSHFRITADRVGRLTTEITSIEVTFGLMITFATAKAQSFAETYRFPIPEWQRVSTQGAHHDIYAYTATGSPNHWMNRANTVPYDENVDTPHAGILELEATVSDPNQNVEGWTHTHHLMTPVTWNIWAKAAPITVRLQGQGPKGFKAASTLGAKPLVIVDDPSTGDGIFIDQDQRATIRAHHKYQAIRALMKLHDYETLNAFHEVEFALHAPLRGWGF